jgi:glycerophosphoryl diester phosphodiesterase
VIRLVLLTLGAALAAPGVAAAATPIVHAHRGGAFVDGTATYAENTLQAFQAAHARGFVVELDTRAVRDGAIALPRCPRGRATRARG